MIPPLLRRCSTAPRRHRRPRCRRRNGLARCRLLITSAPVRRASTLKITSNWDTKTIYDVVARIPGSTYPDEWVMRGNHHDAWVNGADDPLSGMSSELEEARALGELLQQGWHPKRTIVYIAWDGEEPGLLGSTEFVEAHLDDLRQHAVMYVNSDNSGRGYLHVSGEHTLEHFINDVSKDINDPEKNISVWERARLHHLAVATDTDNRAELRNRPDVRITPLGDGSDYAPFLDHAGVPALDLRLPVRMKAAFITPSMTISTGTPISPTRPSSMDARSRRLLELPSCEWLMQT